MARHCHYVILPREQWRRKEQLKKAWDEQTYQAFEQALNDL
jgi:hypothetical protein